MLSASAVVAAAVRSGGGRGRLAGAVKNGASRSVSMLLARAGAGGFSAPARSERGLSGARVYTGRVGMTLPRPPVAPPVAVPMLRWRALSDSAGPPSPEAGAPPADAAAGDVDYIVDATEASFKKDVLDASEQAAVLLDFHADWCGPCKQLTPLLTEAVKALQGRVRLVKIDTDANPQLAAQAQVQSLPTVMGIVKGKLVDKFVGVQAPAHINTFLQNLVEVAETEGATGAGAAGNQSQTQEPPGETLVERIQSATERITEEETFEEAAGTLKDILQVLEAERGEKASMQKALCLYGLAKGASARGEADAARHLLTNLKNNYAVELGASAELQANVASLTIAVASPATSEGMAALQARIDEDPDDLQARYDLAMLLFQENAQNDAMNMVLEVVKRDSSWNEGAAVELAKQFVQSMSQTQDVKAFQQRLANYLFN